MTYQTIAWWKSFVRIFLDRFHAARPKFQPRFQPGWPHIETCAKWLVSIELCDSELKKIKENFWWSLIDSDGLQGYLFFDDILLPPHFNSPRAQCWRQKAFIPGWVDTAFIVGVKQLSMCAMAHLVRNLWEFAAIWTVITHLIFVKLQLLSAQFLIFHILWGASLANTPWKMQRWRMLRTLHQMLLQSYRWFLPFVLERLDVVV